MKKSHFFRRIGILLFSGLIWVACEKSMDFSVSSGEVVFDSYPVDSESIDILTEVEWTATVIQKGEWLIVTPLQGIGDATIKISAKENEAFTERSARIAISGFGVRTDTIIVTQAGNVNIVEEIADKNFRQYCLDKFDNDPKDGIISLKEAKGVYVIEVKGLEISTLAGIEYFPNIRQLNASNNQIESIDLSMNKELMDLNLSFNPLNHIDVSELAQLRDLQVANAVGLTQIDVSKNAKLNWLEVPNNQLTSIDVSNNSELEVLSCSYNQLTSLDVNKNAKLLTLYCSGNSLSNLNLAQNAKLQHLWCSDQKTRALTSLDLSHNTELQRLSCSLNAITSLNLSANTKLTQLRCDVNQISTLDLTRNTVLTDLQCSSNRLTGNIDISKCKSLQYIDFQSNSNLNVIYVWQAFDENRQEYQKDPGMQYIVK